MIDVGLGIYTTVKQACIDRKRSSRTDKTINRCRRRTDIGHANGHAESDTVDTDVLKTTYNTHSPVSKNPQL